MRPESGFSKPAIIRSVVVLPQPDAPEQRVELAGRDVEVDARDGGDPVERLDQLLQPDRAALHPGPADQRGDRLGEPGEVGREPVDIVAVVLNRQQPLLHLAPWREEHAAIVLHQPVQVAESGVDLEEVAEVADRVAAERHAALGADGHHVPAEAVPGDDGFQRGAQPGGAAASRCA